MKVKICKKCKKCLEDCGCDGFQGAEEVERLETLFCVAKGGLCPAGCVHKPGKTACGAIE